MGRFIFPLFLIGLGIFGLAEHQVIDEQWSAMYPDDAARQNALTRCAQEDGMFNRFTPAGRASCYQKYLQVELPPAAPGLTVGVPGGAPGTAPATPTHVVPHSQGLRTNSNQR